MADANTTNFAFVKPEVGASLDSWGTKLNTNWDDIDSLARGFYTYGGTADAITITTGLSLASVPTGFRIRFLATSANTTTTTINTDSIGTVTCKTVTGVDLPAGYIRTDAHTEAYYNGTNWIVDRQAETATPSAGVNGRYFKEASGLMVCTHQQSATNNITDAVGNIFRGTAERTWTFPATFITQPAVTATLDRENGWILSSGYSTTEFRYRPALPTSTASVTNDVDLTAVGRWY